MRPCVKGIIPEKHPYGPEMAVKCAEVMALRRAFDVAVSAREEAWDEGIADSEITVGEASAGATGQTGEAGVPAEDPSGESVPPLPDDARVAAETGVGEGLDPGNASASAVGAHPRYAGDWHGPWVDYWDGKPVTKGYLVCAVCGYAEKASKIAKQQQVGAS